MLMGITTCTWIICIVLHDTYPRIEGTGVYLLAWCP